MKMREPASLDVAEGVSFKIRTHTLPEDWDMGLSLLPFITSQVFAVVMMDGISSLVRAQQAELIGS